MTVNRDDIWYAAKQTKILHAPEKKIETFGETKVHYYVVTDLLDTVGQARIRDGIIEAKRPRLITPDYLARKLTDNFGSEAEEYAEWLVNSGQALRFLEYGLYLHKEEYQEEIVSGDSRSVGENIVRQKEGDAEGPCVVMVGVDDLWEVSLMRFASQLIESSVPGNMQDLSGRGLLEPSGGSGIPAGVRVEIENDFFAARGKPERIKRLGRKLQDFGVFDEYEDRLYGLLKELEK